MTTDQAFLYLDKNYFNDRIMEDFGDSIRGAELDDDYSPDELARTIVGTIRNALNGCKTEEDRIRALKIADDMMSAITGWGLATLTEHVAENTDWTVSA